MRAGLRRREEDDEESAFVSMTDMTVSFLFIVMILLAFFASQLRESETVPRSVHDQVVRERDELQERINQLEREKRDLEGQVAQLQLDVKKRDEAIRQKEVRIRELEQLLEKLRPDQPIEAYLALVAQQRQAILERLQAKLKADFPDLQVVISEEMDALRFKGDGLFQTGRSELLPDKRRIVESIAVRLNEILPCYTLGRLSSWEAGCNAGGAAIEAVQIEGHTDADGQDNSNVKLSTDRANETFFAMTRKEATLVEHLNNRGQPVLSVAGYGKMRPIADNRTPDGKATNRRIDLRIIMVTPRSLEEIAKIRDDLRRGFASGNVR
jgi:flagellar motor protein MotB